MGSLDTPHLQRNQTYQKILKERIYSLRNLATKITRLIHSFHIYSIVFVGLLKMVHFVVI